MEQNDEGSKGVNVNTSFNLNIEIGNRNILVLIEAQGHVYQENYGADADGRRGEIRTEVDDLEITVFDAGGKDITQKLHEKYKAVFEDIEICALNKLVDEYGDA